MTMRLALTLTLLALPLSLFAQAPPVAQSSPVPAEPTPAPPNPRAEVTTSLGRIVIELDAARAPATVANFLRYAADGHYHGTVFHRVAAGLLVQGGRYTPDLQPKPERAPIPSESGNGLLNVRGSVVAARAPGDANSARSEFFINVVDNPQFDHRDATSAYTSGYTVFGRVLEGMDVVDKIQALPVTAQGRFTDHVPQPLPVIERVEIQTLPVETAR